jgi:hypothetical protein
MSEASSTPEPGAAPAQGSVGESVRLVVRSIGTASFGVVAALKQVTTLSEQQLAERLFRAPAELFAGLPRPSAERMAQVLRAAGVEVDVVAGDAAVVPGEGDHDVAVVVRDFSRVTDVAREVMRFLGVDARTARGILCASPSILVGGVSRATVTALEGRFAPLGVEIAVSRPAAAVFDVIVGETATPALRARLVETLRQMGAPIAARHEGPVVVTGLDKAAADRIWEALGRRNPALRVLDRAFERFDVRLEACPRTPEAIAGLVAITGMPEKVVPRVLERLPVVVQQNIGYDALRASLEGLAAIGATAVDELCTLQTFALALTIEAAADRPRAASVLTALAEIGEQEGAALLKKLPARLEGPFSPVHARWLAAELGAVGVTARLVRR